MLQRFHIEPVPEQPYRLKARITLVLDPGVKVRISKKRWETLPQVGLCPLPRPPNSYREAGSGPHTAGCSALRKSHPV
jgi:hypothetical protein